jgi:Mrp family chromosome partitioning ATPase
VADSATLQDLVDGFLLVVRSRHASRDTIRRSLSFLRRERVLGVVLNDQTDNLLSRWLDRRRLRARP